MSTQVIRNKVSDLEGRVLELERLLKELSEGSQVKKEAPKSGTRKSNDG